MPPRKSLVSVVDESVGAMHWLTPADQVTVALARKYAEEIEAAAKSTDQSWPTSLPGTA